ncbi:hypothetical protein Y032_0162g3432 [Ancylostoma ceylanicum]|uniref:TM2 domain-containing protein n=1 Tax=Ancylostoma ceylanicum TaxID=53326 RepID=A0A016SX00_9BILA|nr:hypothetical protein Y032_0162g3432 [Ancylostoma ceylanicum]
MLQKVLLVLAYTCVTCDTTKRIGSATSAARANSRAHCSRVDCQADASCLSCKFPVDCELDEPVRVNCTSVKECGVNQISVNREAFCRYCWQSDPSDFDCMPQSNCSTTSTQLILTECTLIHDRSGFFADFYRLFYSSVVLRIKKEQYKRKQAIKLTGDSGLVVHPNVICKGRRTFNKRIRCSWSSGISWAKAMFLSVTLGGFGADRFYLGLWKSAIGKLFSFGGLGVWTVVDVVLIATGYIRPADGSMYM